MSLYWIFVPTSWILIKYPFESQFHPSSLKLFYSRSSIATFGSSHLHRNLLNQLSHRCSLSSTCVLKNTIFVLFGDQTSSADFRRDGDKRTILNSPNIDPQDHRIWCHAPWLVWIALQKFDCNQQAEFCLSKILLAYRDTLNVSEIWLCLLQTVAELSEISRAYLALHVPSSNWMAYTAIDSSTQAA